MAGRNCTVVWLTAIAMTLSAGSVTYAQEADQVELLLEECKRNINRSPLDGQRSCREAIRQAQWAFFPEQYTRHRREASLLLGESYYKVGRIGEAVSLFDSVAASEPTDWEIEQLTELREETERLFRPLRITIRDRQIPLLSYIDGMDLDFVYPRRLTSAQINRIQILRDETVGREDEFQFVAFDDEGQAYMEISYFPVITFSGRSVGYSLIIEERRRYRFNFSKSDSSAVEIFWEDNAGWELIESVPRDMVKVELPEKYSFSIETEGTPQMITGGGIQHVYVPAAVSTEIHLEESQDRTWERAYDIAMFAVIIITGGAALSGAR